MVYIGMTYIVMAYIGMAYIVLAYVVMARIVIAVIASSPAKLWPLHSQQQTRRLSAQMF